VPSNDRQRSITSLPAAIAAVLAAVGVAGMIVLFVSAEQVGSGDVGMKSADAAYRAGATITPTSPATPRPSNPNSNPQRSILVSDDLRKDL